MLEETQTMTFRDKVDIRLLFMQQVTRCLQTVGTPFFGENVDALMRMLPTASYLLIANQESTWVDVKEVLQYRANRGVQVGKQDDPMVWNSDHSDLGYSSEPGFTVDRLDDGSVDWNDPRIYSPRLITREEVDYKLLLRMVLAEAQEIGILWTNESGGLVNLPGNILEILKVSKNMPRTPT